MSRKSSLNETEINRKALIEIPTIKHLDTKIYPRRWLNLFLFLSFGIVANLHSFQIIIIKNILCRYYNVSEFTFNWTFIVYAVSYIVVFPPVLYTLNKKGLKVVCVIGAIFTCLGCWVKVLSAFYRRFDVLIVGQLLAASAWTISINMPSHLASRWFESNRISFATSIGQMANKIGIIISQTSSLLVKNNDDIGKDLYSLFLGTAVPSTCIMIFMIFFFEAEPKIPPSKTRAFQKLHCNIEEPWWKSVLRNLKNKHYLLLCNSFSLHLLVLNGTFVFLNSFYIAHFKNKEQFIGLIGMIILVSGTVMSIALGVLQDRIKQFKKLLLIVSGLAIISKILYILALHAEIQWIFYITAVFVGFFLLGFITVATQTCIEITYPEPEGSSISFLTMSHQIYEFIFLPICSKIMESFGEIAVQGILVGALIISFISTLINKDVQKRQQLAARLDDKTCRASISELEVIKTSTTS